MFKLTDRIPEEGLQTFCHKYHIKRLALFGSALRDQMGPDSDIDILVEFDPNHMPGLFNIARMEIELAEMIGIKVDLRTLEDLSKYFRNDVANTAKVYYEKA